MTGLNSTLHSLVLMCRTIYALERKFADWFASRGLSISSTFSLLCGTSHPVGISESRHGVVSTLPSNNNTQEEEKEGGEHKRKMPASHVPFVPVPPVIVDLLDDEFEDDWNKGNSDDDDW